MVNFAQLRDSDPESLNSVIEQWASAVEKLGDARSHGADVLENMENGDWDGQAAASATESTSGYSSQLAAAVTEATGVRTILDDSVSLFSDAKSDLDDAITEVGEEPRLKISDDGAVSVDSGGMTGMSPDAATRAIEALQTKADDLNERITEAVTSATEADENTAAALRFTAIDEDDPHAFNAHAPQNLFTATVMREYESVPSEHELVNAAEKFELINPADNDVIMTQEEWDMMLKHGPVDAYKAFQIYEDADDASEGMFGGEGLRDGHSDAWRHAYWNARMTNEFGAEWTREFTTAHEGNPNNPPLENSMDLYNNEIGIQIALDNPDASPEELSQLVEEAVLNGDTVVINDQDQITPSDTGVPGQEHQGGGPTY